MSLCAEQERSTFLISPGCPFPSFFGCLRAQATVKGKAAKGIEEVRAECGIGGLKWMSEPSPATPFLGPTLCGFLRNMSTLPAFNIATSTWMFHAPSSADAPRRNELVFFSVFNNTLVGEYVVSSFFLLLWKASRKPFSYVQVYFPIKPPLFHKK